PGGDGLGKVVRRRDGMDHLVPAELVEGPVDAGRSRLGGIAPAPAAAHDAPAYLRTRPAFRLPRPDPADPLAAGLLDHREHRVTLQVPAPDHRRQPAPGHRPRLQPADMAGGLPPRPGPGPGVAGPAARAAPPEAGGAQAQAGQVPTPA